MNKDRESTNIDIKGRDVGGGWREHDNETNNKILPDDPRWQRIDK
jgi:hypothetical protein